MILYYTIRSGELKYNRIRYVLDENIMGIVISVSTKEVYSFDDNVLLTIF